MKNSLKSMENVSSSSAAASVSCWTDPLESFWDRVRENAPCAHAELYERCRATVLPICWSWKSARNLEDEICQDIVWKIMQKVEKEETVPDDEKGFNNLLRRMTVCRIKDAYRKQRRKEHVREHKEPCKESGRDNTLEPDKIVGAKQKCYRIVSNFSDIGAVGGDSAKESGMSMAADDASWRQYKQRQSNEQVVEPDEAPGEVDAKPLSLKQGELMAIVERVLKRKTPQNREAFLDSCSEGVSLREIAQKHRMSENSLCQLRGRTKRQMKALAPESPK